MKLTKESYNAPNPDCILKILINSPINPNNVDNYN